MREKKEVWVFEPKGKEERQLLDTLTNSIKNFKIKVPPHIVHLDKFLEVQDFSFFQSVFKDRPSDIDLSFEYYGHVLIIEFKRTGAYLKEGQDRLLKALALNDNIQILLVTGNLEKDFQLMVQKISKTGVTEEHPFTQLLLKRWLVKWMQDCKNSPVGVDIPNSENLKVYKKKRTSKYIGVPS